jgi:hypothetical protein
MTILPSPLRHEGGTPSRGPADRVSDTRQRQVHGNATAAIESRDRHPGMGAGGEPDRTAPSDSPMTISSAGAVTRIAARVGTRPLVQVSPRHGQPR